jgi:hypothetical protein
VAVAAPLGGASDHLFDLRGGHPATSMIEIVLVPLNAVEEHRRTFLNCVAS